MIVLSKLYLIKISWSCNASLPRILSHAFVVQSIICIKIMSTSRFIQKRHALINLLFDVVFYMFSNIWSVLYVSYFPRDKSLGNLSHLGVAMWPFYVQKRNAIGNKNFRIHVQWRHFSYLIEIARETLFWLMIIFFDRLFH